MDLGRLADNLRRITVEVTSVGNAVGAGVVWAPGWIVTNAHVIRYPRVAVRFADGRREDGGVVAGDRRADLAVLRGPDGGFPAALSDESDTLPVGPLVRAI